MSVSLNVSWLYCLSFIGPHFKFMAVGGTPVGPVLAGPILARASYISFYFQKLVKFILLGREILSKSICNYILYYLVW